MEVEVTSAARTEQPIARTAAAIYVVTNEMIRRCGARNIPEVLRTVPGVNVARINASAWAISIRGFNGRFADKLLVQIDGMAIYSPLQSGVFWDREPVMLEDIERIEVIRGPGGTNWGNNAVNGIINIVTKSSKDTTGLYADIGGGNEHRQFSDLRGGGRSGNLTYRVYGTNMDDDCGYVPLPNRADDYHHYVQGGFRTDWTPNCRDTITIQGDLVKGESNPEGYLAPLETSNPTYFQKTSFLTRWARKIDEDTNWAAQCYYYNPHGKNNVILETNAHFDVDFYYHAKRGRHDIVCGCGYRNDYENMSFTFGPILQANIDTEQIPSYFVQDTVTLREDRLFATVGSKFDNNSVTHFEYQPTAKLTWTPDKRTSFWGAITRAVRTPSLIERTHGVNIKSEDVLSYELGCRRQPDDDFFWEFAGYYNRYSNLLAAYGDIFGEHGNVGHGETYGFETNATYKVNPRWRLTGSYSFLIEYVYYPANYIAIPTPGLSPRNQFYLQSGWDIGDNVTLDLMFRYVDSLKLGVKQYFVGDVRLAWRPRKNLEFSAVGQNLFNGRYYEFVSSQEGTKATEQEPGFYGMVSWRY